MQDGPTISRSHFQHSPVKTEFRPLVRSTCKRCGKSRIVSDYDGTLKRWEARHECEQTKDSNGSAAYLRLLGLINPPFKS